MDNFPLSNIQLNPSEGQLTQDATSLQGYSGIYRQQVQNSPFFGATTSSGASPGAAQQFFGKVGSIFGESGHLIESAADWVGRQAVTAVEAPIKFAIDVATTPWRMSSLNYQINTASMQSDHLSNELDNLTRMFKSGAISHAEYSDQLKSLNDGFNSVLKQETDISQKAQSYKDDVAQTAVSTIADLLMFTGGGVAAQASLVGKAAIADSAKLLLGDGAKDALSPISGFIERMAANKAEYGSLSQATQNALKASVTDTFMQTSKGMTSQQIAKATAINVLLKYPLTFNYINSTGSGIYHDMSTGKYGDALKQIGFNAALLLSGGPIGQAMKYGGDALKGIAGRTFGQSSFLDELSKTIGDGNPNGLYQAIKDNPDTVKAFQALEATNMAAEDNRAVSAALRVTNGLKANGWDLSNATHQDVVDNVMGWHQAQTVLHDSLIKSGMSEAETSRYVVGRWTAPQANELATLLTKGDLNGMEQTAEDRLKVWNDYKLAHPNSAVANNENLDRQITKMIQNTSVSSALYEKIRSIKVQNAAKVPGLASKDWKAIGKLGYVPIIPSKLEAPFIQGTQKLITNVGETGEFFQKAVQPMPVLKTVGALLTHLGMSPERTGQSTYDLFTSNLANNLQNTSAIEKNMIGEDAETQAKSLMSKISNYVNETNSKKFLLSHPPISDMRQLTTKEIMTATGVEASQAKEIAGAISQSMLDISLAERGLGSKMLDYVQSMNSGGRVGMNGYLRLQGAGRFAWNPFFKMKLAAKTEILSSMEGRGYVGSKFDQALGLVFNNRYNLGDTAKMLESRGVFGGIGYSGQAADEAVAASRDVKGTVLKSQKLSIAGLVHSQAERAGMDVETFADTYPNEVRDTVESILHYNPKADFMNSPMARTLNFAFFPFRFNLKVSGYMARTLAKQDAITQIAVIHGMMQAHNFLTSTQGQIWYSQNSDVIGLLNYFTPLEEIKTIAAFGNITHESIGSFGELGGLPIGFIPQMLQAEGLWNPSQPYLNPKTGQATPNYIPNNSRAALATAVGSFLGSIFTYPGSEAGLPSKTKIDKTVGQGLTGTKSADWTPVTPTNLTPQQQQFQQAIQALPANQQKSQQAPTENVPPSTIAPPTENGTAPPKYTASELRSRGKVKKSQEPLSPLPGQNSIGQVL